jgi:hypothetical protein
MHQRTLCVAASLAAFIPFLASPSMAVVQENAQRLQELESRLADESETWLEFREHARSDEERAELVAAFPRDELVRELEAIAGAERDSDTGARAWLACMRLGALLDDQELYGRALERLVTDHLESPRMPALSLDLVYGAPSWSARPAAAALRTILAGTQDKGLQAMVLGDLALLVGLDERFGAAGREEAESLLARIETEFVGAADFPGMDGKTFAAGARHEIEHLRVGERAPDFELSDQDGVRFKLSDYRGRVVLLDFWGFV